MPKQLYALEPGGKKRLELSWNAFWKDFTVSLDGKPVGVIPDQKALTKGQEMTLRDGSTLKVQLVTQFAGAELRVLRDGRPLPGSGSDPETRFKNAYIMVYLLAGLNLVLGTLALLFQVALLQELGIGLGSIIFGLILLVLGFFTQRKSMIALILAIVIFAVDGIAGFVMAASQGYPSSASGMVVRIFLLIPMIQGVKAMKELRQAAQ